MLQEFEGAWRALSVSFSAADLKEHEENTQVPSGYYDEHRKTWMDVFEEEKKKIEEDPHVIICSCFVYFLHLIIEPFL